MLKKLLILSILLIQGIGIQTTASEITGYISTGKLNEVVIDGQENNTTKKSKIIINKTENKSATIETTEQEKTIELKKYPDGALLRNPDNKIYVLENNKKRHIATAFELRNYRGQEIFTVDNQTLDQYAEAQNPKKYNNHDLIRGEDMRIFVIDNDQKIYIPTLDELRKDYRGQVIFNVDYLVINSYKSKIKSQDASLSESRQAK